MCGGGGNQGGGGAPPYVPPVVNQGQPVRNPVKPKRGGGASILTSSQGVTGQADSSKKSVLGG